MRRKNSTNHAVEQIFTISITREPKTHRNLWLSFIESDKTGIYSAGVITISTLLPELSSWRAKAAIDSGVWAFTRFS